MSRYSLGFNGGNRRGDSEEANDVDGSDGNRREKKLSKKEQAELLRRQVDTVGLVRRTGRKNSKRDFGWNAFRRMGRQDGNAHHGASRVHFAVALRAGGRTRASTHVL